MAEAAVIEFARRKSARCATPCETERDYEEHLSGRHVCARVHAHAIRSQDPDHICRCGHWWAAASAPESSVTASPPSTPGAETSEGTGEAQEARQ